MSTTIVTTWATDYLQLGPIYPFVGSEMIMYIAALAFWISFHLLQFRAEAKEIIEEQDLASGNKEAIENQIRG